MAEVVGAFAMSHGPQLLAPPERWDELPSRTKGPFNPKPGIEAELTEAAKRSNAARCAAAIAILKAHLAALKPDTIVILGDDQEENILFDNMPPFMIFMGKSANATLRFRYFGEKAEDQMTRYGVNAPLARAILSDVMAAGFDPSWSKELRYNAGLGHAFGRVLAFLLDAADATIVPIMINTYYPPSPSAARCYNFGAAIGHAIRSSPDAHRVVLIASGGLSHTKIDEGFDARLLKAIENDDAAYLKSIPSALLRGGTSEVLNWIAVAGAMSGHGEAKTIDYVPCYRNADGVGCAMGFAEWQV